MEMTRIEVIQTFAYLTFTCLILSILYQVIVKEVRFDRFTMLMDIGAAMTSIVLLALTYGM